METPQTNTAPNTDPVWDLAEAVAHLVRVNTPNMSTDQMGILLGITTRLRDEAQARGQGAETALEEARQRLMDMQEVAGSSGGILGGIL